MASTTPAHTDPASAILALCAPDRAGADTSITPEQVARSLCPDGLWQRQLHLVRKAALMLAETGQIEILRKGKPIAPAEARGVIRLRLKHPQPTPPVQQG